jgi:outer membrane protein assembly factor BamE (lipoprotein component of BamABCDE complex)
MTVKSRQIMKQFTHFCRYFLPLPLLLDLSGCAVVNVRGHEIEPEQLDKIQVGQSSKEDVVKILGTPSSIGTFNDQTWIYMSDTTQTRAFFSPTVLKSNTTRIVFDAKGIVNNIDSLTEKDHQVVSHVQRCTPTSGHSFGVIEQIFGNFGRFNGKDPDK